MRLTVILSLIAVTLSLASAGLAQNRGTVAVIPTVNASGEKWADLKARQILKIDDWASTNLHAAGFTLKPFGDVKDSVAALALDMADEENWRRPVLQQIGEKAGADYVLFCVVVSTEQKEQKRLWYVDKEGRTDVRVWLIDVKAGKGVISGKTVIGRSGGNRIAGGNKGSERQIQAAANAVRDATREFLAPYKAK